MTKKENDVLDSWRRTAAAFRLQRCLDKDNQVAEEELGEKTIAEIYPEEQILQLCYAESSKVYYHPGFVGILRLIMALVKHSLRRKKAKNFIVVLR